MPKENLRQLTKEHFFWKHELHDLIENPVTKNQFKDIHVSRALDEIQGITVNFSPKKEYLRRDPAINNGNGHLKFGGIVGLLDSRACIGIKVVNEGQEDSAWEESKRAIAALKYEIPLHDKAEVSLVHPEDLLLWNRFYHHIAKENLLKRVGPRVFTLSGLHRQNHETFDSEIFNFMNVLDKNSEYLSKCGVFRQGPSPDLGMDHAFFTKDNKILGVPISHVKTAKIEGGLLLEEVSKKKILCPGFVIRKPWETKREAYSRAERAKVKFVEKYNDKNIAIPVVSAGQNSLWKKLGFFSERKNQISQAKISAEEIVKFLYLGKDNLHPGPFSRSGLSLPPDSSSLGIDILLVSRNKWDMNFVYSALDGIYGYTFKRSFGGGGRWELGKVDNVGGLLMVPDNWQTDTKINERIDVAKQVLMRYIQHRKDVNIVPVDSVLFDIWRENGKPFIKSGEIHSGKIENSFGTKRITSVISEKQKEDGNFLGIFQQSPQIGGVQMVVATRRQGDTAYHIMDMGGVWSNTPPAYQEITARPTTASGVKLELELQGLPMVPGILYPEYILQTAVGMSSNLANAENLSSVASYIRSELAHRFTLSELKDVFGTKKALDILSLGKLDEQIWYEKGNQHLSSVTVTHAHDDHDRGLFALDDATFIMRRQTLALLKAKTERAGTWRQRLLELSLIQHPKVKNAFKKDPREVLPIDYNSQQIELEGGILERLLLVDHSIPGTGAPFFSSKDNLFKSVLYTADIRKERDGNTQKMIDSVSGKPQIIIAESTNPIDTNKASVGVSEDDVKSSLSKVLYTYDKRPVIILTPWHGLERMNTILEVASERGRKVAFGYDHWEAIIQMEAEFRNSPDRAEGFGYHYPKIGESAALWARFATRPQKYQETLQGLADGGKLGILSDKQLLAEAGDWVVVTSPTRLLMKDFNGGFWPRKAAVVYSSPFPYAINQKYQAAANKEWVEKTTGGNFIADFEVYGRGGRVSPGMSRFGPLTSSGHGTYQQNLQLLIDLLGGQYKDKEIVVIHGEHTLSYAQMLERDIKKRLGLKNPNDLKITGRLNVYNPSNPRKQKGHWIRLD